jgi:hypothetical protein
MDYDGLGRSENAFHHLLLANRLKRRPRLRRSANKPAATAFSFSKAVL